MSNKEQLQTNNNSLEECIARINAAKEVAAELPAAGGAAIEAWTGTIDTIGGPLGSGAPSLYYIDETFTPKILGDYGSHIEETITIPANTLLFFVPAFEVALNNAEEITGDYNMYSYTCTVIRPTANNFSVSRG